MVWYTFPLRQDIQELNTQKKTINLSLKIYNNIKNNIFKADGQPLHKNGTHLYALLCFIFNVSV